MHSGAEEQATDPVAGPGYIVVEGPIGVGKTSLARRLAQHFSSELLLEGADENPFLERFYENPKQAALPAQLFFLFQRVQQIQALRQGDLFRPALVSDFALEKDRLFAELTLGSEELNLYEQVYATLSVDPPKPDLMIYLQAPVDVLFQRIANRARYYEQRIDRRYLEDLIDRYTRFFHTYDDAPLLIVNTTGIDPISRDEDFDMLLERLQTVRHGRHYFSPEPLGI